MYRLASVIFLSFIGINLIYSQQLSTTAVHEKTLQFFQNKDWNSLIDLGEKALKQDIDSYFINYRMGVAYYQVKNYRKSAPFLEKALKRTPNEEVLIEYLYYAYLLGGQYENADNFLGNLKSDVKKNLLKKDIPTIKNIFLDAAFLQFDNYKIENPSNGNFQQRIRQDLYSVDIGLTHKIGGPHTLTHAVSILKGKHQVVIDDEQYSRDLLQKEYYVGANIFLKKSTLLKMAFHYINTDLTSSNPSLKSNSDSYIAFLGFKKNYSLVDLMLSTSYANLNDGNQFQQNLNLIFLSEWKSKLFLKKSIFFSI